MMTHTFLVDIAHRPSPTKIYSQFLGGMGQEYGEFLRELGKSINDPYNLPLCSNPEEMYSFVLSVFSQTCILVTILVFLSIVIEENINEDD